MGESYAKLAIQPIDLIRAFKVDFCLASIIKWLTKWHMEKKSEYLNRAKYYIPLCEDIEYSNSLVFALRMYCILNGFMKDNSSTCMMLEVIQEVMKGNIDNANFKLLRGWSGDER